MDGPLKRGCEGCQQVRAWTQQLVCKQVFPRPGHGSGTRKYLVLHRQRLEWSSWLR